MKSLHNFLTVMLPERFNRIVMTALFILILIQPAVFSDGKPALKDQILPMKDGWFFQAGDSPQNDQGQFTWALPGTIDAGWAAVQFPRKTNKPSGKNFVWFKTVLPGPGLEESYLYIENATECMEVYLDGLLIYRFGELNATNTHYYLGWPSHLIRLPAGFQGKTLAIRLFSLTDTIGIEGIPRLGTSRAQFLSMIREGIFGLIMASVIIMIGFFLLVIFAINWRQKSFLGLGLFSISIGLWRLARIKLTYQIFNDPVFWQHLELVSFYFFSAGIYYFVEQLTGRGFLSVTRRSWQYSFAFTTLAIILDAFQIVPIRFMVTPFIYSVIIMGVVNLIYIITRAVKGNREAGIFALSSLVFLLFGLHESLIALGIVPLVRTEMTLIIFIYILFIGYILIRRFHLVYSNLQKYTAELDELNKSLDEKVMERTNELEKANQEIEHATRQKITLFINLAHETKTPLTLISNYLQSYISKTEMTPELQIIKTHIDKLQRDMINFLDSEKLSRGQLFYNHDQVVALSETLEQKAVLFQVLAARKNITLNSHIIPQLYCKADPYAIDRIINNILDNAIKYTPSGGNVSAALSADQENVFMEIKDNGLGMNEDQQKHVFQPFYQLAHEKRNVQGIGMGLSIVRQIVESLHGEIRLKSAPGKGSCFTVILPLYSLQPGEKLIKEFEPSMPLDTNTHSQEPEQPELRTGLPHILLLEDNTELSGFLIQRLSAKYNTHYARDGHEALQKLKGMPVPNLVISDVMMDGMNGFQFYEELQKNQVLSAVPFIYLTARTSNDDKLKGLSDGAVDYIYKPFSYEALEAKIQAILRNQELKKILFENEKYAALGKLLGGISHEIQNPLNNMTAILENLRLALNITEIKDNQKIQGYLNRIETNVERMSSIVGSVKMLYYKKDFSVETLALDACLRRIVAAFPEADQKKIHMEVPGNLLLQTNEDVLNRIFSNLISNALDSSDGKGQVWISAVPEKSGYRISVRDNGSGIPEDQIDHIFEAFYTTKEMGKGTGLGLTIVKDMVEKMGWKIHIQSRPGAGSEFMVDIP